MDMGFFLYLGHRFEADADNTRQDILILWKKDLGNKSFQWNDARMEIDHTVTKIKTAAVQKRSVQHSDV